MKEHRHFTSEDVQRFKGAGLTLPTLRLVIRELLGDCALCQDAVEQAARSHPAPAEPCPVS